MTLQDLLDSGIEIRGNVVIVRLNYFGEETARFEANLFEQVSTDELEEFEWFDVESIYSDDHDGIPTTFIIVQSDSY